MFRIHCSFGAGESQIYRQMNRMPLKSIQCVNGVSQCVATCSNSKVDKFKNTNSIIKTDKMVVVTKGQSKKLFPCNKINNAFIFLNWSTFTCKKGQY